MRKRSKLPSNMRNNPRFNNYFVSVVKKYEVLYNHTTEGYASKECVKEAWQRVAKEVNCPEQECKERWRCLRVCFLRQLRHSHPDTTTGNVRHPKKSYYLADALSFLLPYVKPKYAPLGYEPVYETLKPSSSVKFESDPSYEEENSEQPEEDSEDQHIYSEELTDHETEQDQEFSNPSTISSSRIPECYPQQEIVGEGRTPQEQAMYTDFVSGAHSESASVSISAAEDHLPAHTEESQTETGNRRKRPRKSCFDDESRPGPGRPRRSTGDPNVVTVEYSDRGATGVSRQAEEGDGDLLFLKSLLPDLRKLTDKQKRKFKQRALGLFDEIIEEDTGLSTAR